jgi:hypothetical protein
MTIAGCRKRVDTIVKNELPGGYELELHRFDDEEDLSITPKSDGQLEVELIHEEGRVTMIVLDEQNNQCYKGNLDFDTSFVVNIPNGEKANCIIKGEKATGKVILK